MLRFDLDNENETILNYHQNIRQCETLSEFAMAERYSGDPGARAGPSNRSGHRSTGEDVDVVVRGGWPPEMAIIWSAAKHD